MNSKNTQTVLIRKADQEKLKAALDKQPRSITALDFYSRVIRRGLTAIGGPRQ